MSPTCWARLVTIFRRPASTRSGPKSRDESPRSCFRANKPVRTTFSFWPERTTSTKPVKRPVDK